MAYKKPEVVAKSESKQTFVAGCSFKANLPRCTSANEPCRVGRIH